MRIYTTEQFKNDVKTLADAIERQRSITNELLSLYSFIYGVPRGGIPLAIALSERLKIPLTDNPHVPCFGDVLVVDDVIDSGKTRWLYDKFDFACLHIKKNVCKELPGNHIYYIENGVNEWIQYWWEGKEVPAEDAVIRMIQAIGDDSNREGMLDTPKRVVKSWEELYRGYKENPESVFTKFSGDGYNQIVLLKDIEFYSTCEHHLLPFFGKAHIAYIPSEKVIGISKLARLMEIYSRRLQIQERIGDQITKDIMDYLDAQAAACIIEAQHFCMKARGVGKQHSIMTTSSMKGTFLENPTARAELMSLIGK